MNFIFLLAPTKKQEKKGGKADMGNADIISYDTHVLVTVWLSVDDF